MGNNQPRSFKTYRENEAEIMEALGLKPTINSGSGWIEKEDGQNEFLICQLKSTDKRSISLKQEDLNTLVYNAKVAHKIPIFAVNFLNNNDVWLIARPGDFGNVADCVREEYSPPVNDYFVEPPTLPKKKVIKSSAKAYNDYTKKREIESEENAKKWKQIKKSLSKR